MTVQTWLFFCATHTVLCFTPGPAVLLVLSMALGRGARAGLGASLGILAVNTIYFAVSATSLGAILVASWTLFSVIKWMGAAYLTWLGLRMIFSRTSTENAAPAWSSSGHRAFVSGLITQAANPKALVFFTALLPQFIDPTGKIPIQVLILGVSGQLIELAVLSLYVAACQRARQWVGSARLATPLQRLGGLFLVGAGARLAATRHA